MLVGLLHNSSSKLLTNAGKRGPRFSLVLLLLLTLAEKPGAKSKVAAQVKPLCSLPLAATPREPSLQQPPPKAEGDAVLPADSPLLSASVKQAWMKLPKVLPCPVLPLSCFTALASCGDVVVHVV